MLKDNLHFFRLKKKKCQIWQYVNQNFYSLSAKFFDVEKKKHLTYFLSAKAK